MMKIAIIGAGAVGSVIGGLLAREGENVVLIGRKPHVDVINSKGLHLSGILGEMDIPLTASEHLDFKPELAFLTVKTQDVEQALNEVKQYISGVPIITMQNGIQSDNLASGLLGKENILSSVIIFHSIFLEPGKVTYYNPGSNIALLIGEPFVQNGIRVKDIAKLLKKALPVEISQNINGAHWTKLLWNLNNAIPAITGLPAQEVNQDSFMRKISISLMKEGLDIVKTANIDTAPVPGVPLSSIKIMVKMPLSIASYLVKMRSKALGEIPVFGSTLQSIKRGKRTEIDYLNGEIVKLGREMGKSTPYNTIIVDLVHKVEKSGKYFTVTEISEHYNCT